LLLQLNQIEPKLQAGQYQLRQSKPDAPQPWGLANSAQNPRPRTSNGNTIQQDCKAELLLYYS